MSNYSSSFDYNEYSNDTQCDVEFIRDIEMKSFARDESERKERYDKCLMSCITCVSLVIFITVMMYTALWLFELCNIKNPHSNSNSSSINNTLINTTIT